MTDVKSALQPFLDGDLPRWRGLPEVSVRALAEAFGEPLSVDSAELGDDVAERRAYPQFTAYVRDGYVVLVELLDPPASAFETLGPPTEILAHEILAPGAYVHEYLYADRGLLLSVAKPFDRQQLPRVVRCRGIRPVRDANDLGSDLYLAFEDQTVWSDVNERHV